MKQNKKKSNQIVTNKINSRNKLESTISPFSIDDIEKECKSLVRSNKSTREYPYLSVEEKEDIVLGLYQKKLMDHYTDLFGFYTDNMNGLRGSHFCENVVLKKMPNSESDILCEKIDLEYDKVHSQTLYEKLDLYKKKVIVSIKFDAWKKIIDGLRLFDIIPRDCIDKIFKLASYNRFELFNVALVCKFTYNAVSKVMVPVSLTCDFCDFFTSRRSINEKCIHCSTIEKRKRTKTMKKIMTFASVIQNMDPISFYYHRDALFYQIYTYCGLSCSKIGRSYSIILSHCLHQIFENEENNKKQSLNQSDSEIMQMFMEDSSNQQSALYEQMNIFPPNFSFVEVDYDSEWLRKIVIKHDDISDDIPALTLIFDHINNHLPSTVTPMNENNLQQLSRYFDNQKTMIQKRNSIANNGTFENCLLSIFRCNNFTLNYLNELMINISNNDYASEVSNIHLILRSMDQIKKELYKLSLVNKKTYHAVKNILMAGRVIEPIHKHQTKPNCSTIGCKYRNGHDQYLYLTFISVVSDIIKNKKDQLTWKNYIDINNECMCCQGQPIVSGIVPSGTILTKNQYVVCGNYHCNDIFYLANDYKGRVARCHSCRQ
jgi:hypothetical protein